MQTFLPYGSFRRSAAILDMKRLGKQRVETLQIMSGLHNTRLITSKLVPTGKVRVTTYDDGVVDRERIYEEIQLDEPNWEFDFYNGSLRGGWSAHPASRMWRGYECALMRYQVAVCEAWIARGYRDTCLAKTRAIHAQHCTGEYEAPPWLGDADFHRSHRSNLLRKDSAYYSHFKGFRGVPDDLEYVWPRGKDI